MKLLISTYACLPNRGSDHGVGWNWTTEAHRLGRSDAVAGVHIAIQAFAKLLTVDSTSWLPQMKLFELYDSHDLLLARPMASRR